MSAQKPAAPSAPRPAPSLVHVANVGPEGAITPVRTPSTTSTAMVVPTVTEIPRVGAGIGIEIRCGGRSLVVGPGFDRELLTEVIRFLEGLPPC